MKIALIGYGKMGRMIEQTAISRGHEIVSIIDVNNQDDFDKSAFSSADVAIEFTSPMAAYGNYLKAFKHHVKVVSGSTGWMKDHGDDVKRLCNEEGNTLFWASNFSIGVAIFSAVNRYLAKIMNNFPQYNVTMEETHHVHKLDAPSGTAISLAEEIIENLDRKNDWVKGLQVHADGTRTGSNETAINCRLLPYGEMKCRAYTRYLTTVKRIPSPLRTMPTTARALLLARYLPQNTRRIIQDYCRQVTYFRS